MRRLQEVDIWEGDTFCANYGRKTVVRDAWLQECLNNRHTVEVLRNATNRDYWAWTLLDDWKQPAKFVAETIHGIAIYFTQSEAHLMKWKHANYPVQASLDIIHSIQAMAMPTSEGIMGAIPSMYPHYKVKGSTGDHLMKITKQVQKTKFPNLMRQDWTGFHDKLYHTGINIMKGITPEKATGPKPGPQPGPTPGPQPASISRRLTSLWTEGPPLQAPTTEQCAADDIICTNCNIMDEFVNDILKVFNVTGEYYKHKYIPQVSYLFDALAQYQSTYAQANSKPYSPVPDNVQLPYPGNTLNTDFMDQPTPNQTLSTTRTSRKVQQHTDWRNALTQFFTNRGDEKVPVFGHTLWWYIQYPLRPCDTLQMAYNSCQTPNYSIEDAVVLMIYVALGLKVLGWLTGFYFPGFIRYPIIFFAFMIFRYNYVPRCMPVMPLCLASDIQYLFKDIVPACLCQLVPALVVNHDKCSPQNCWKTDNGILYRNCPKTELGFANPLVFAIRWQFPTAFVHMFSSWYSPFTIFKDYPTIHGYLDAITHHVPVTDEQVTCTVLGAFDVVLAMFAIRLAFSIVPRMTKTLFETIVAAWATLAIALPIIFGE